jgi:hypothetical protein
MSHLSTLTLHRLRYGELGGTERDGARAHLRSCARCAERLGVQEAERATFVLQAVPEPLRNRGEPQDGFVRRLLRELVPFAVAAVAAAVVTVAVPVLRASPDGAEADTVRLRGTMPEIEAWVDLGSGPRPLRDGESLGSGDRVQLRYDSHGAPSVALAGRDASGVVEVYTLTAPSAVGLTTAPFALELDDAPGQQELFVITSEDPLDERTVEAALEGPVPGVTVSRVAFPKRIDP